MLLTLHIALITYRVKNAKASFSLNGNLRFEFLLVTWFFSFYKYLKDGLKYLGTQFMSLDHHYQAVYERYNITPYSYLHHELAYLHFPLLTSSGGRGGLPEGWGEWQICILFESVKILWLMQSTPEFSNTEISFPSNFGPVWSGQEMNNFDFI